MKTYNSKFIKTALLSVLILSVTNSFAGNVAVNVSTSQTTSTTAPVQALKLDPTTLVPTTAPVESTTPKTTQTPTTKSDATPKTIQRADKKQSASKRTTVKKKVSKLQVLKALARPKEGDKSWIGAVLLCFFLGGLGIHRFYLGYVWQGVVQLLTAGGCGIWALIDFIRILMKTLKPKNGNYKD